MQPPEQGGRRAGERRILFSRLEGGVLFPLPWGTGAPVSGASRQEWITALFFVGLELAEGVALWDSQPPCSVSQFPQQTSFMSLHVHPTG